MRIAPSGGRLLANCLQMDIVVDVGAAEMSAPLNALKFAVPLFSPLFPLFVLCNHCPAMWDESIPFAPAPASTCLRRCFRDDLCMADVTTLVP